MMEQKFEKLSTIFQNSETTAKLFVLSPEEAVAYLKNEYNLDFTVDELNDVALGIKAAMQDGAGDELSSEQLEDVTGGGKGSGAYYAGYYIGKTAKVVGTAVGIAGFAVAIGAISW